MQQARTPIPFTHWSHRVDVNALADAAANPDGYWGEIVTGLVDIEQAMAIIVTTPKLSVPTEPEKFCDALNFMDRPRDVAIPMVTREVWDGLTRWEPRIVVERVEVEPVTTDHFRVPVFWRPRADVLAEINRTVLDLSSREAGLGLIDRGLLA